MYVCIYSLSQKYTMSEASKPSYCNEEGPQFDFERDFESYFTNFVLDCKTHTHTQSMLKRTSTLKCISTQTVMCVAKHYQGP